jgi:hypothetical protein
MKFTIDAANWRCWDRGKGSTILLNKEGYRCCLGFVENQLGIPDEELLDVCTPSGVDTPENILTKKSKHTGLIDNDLTETAMYINDSSDYTYAGRMEALTKLFAEHGHELEFINIDQLPEGKIERSRRNH